MKRHFEENLELFTVVILTIYDSHFSGNYKQFTTVFVNINLISQGVSISLPSRGAGYLIPPLQNQGRSCFSPHGAKSYLETYKSYDQMQNFRPLSKKFSEISRFEKFEFLRFCFTLTHRNCHNSLNFWDTGLIFWIYSSFYVFYKSCLAT